MRLEGRAAATYPDVTRRKRASHDVTHLAGGVFVDSLWIQSDKPRAAL
ncbi:hypothetical protein MIC448_2630003 [Microbacterium sp. C448]|nr:hypothetical protein MIC448_2630003 [Microbacterium sp. C448]